MTDAGVYAGAAALGVVAGLRTMAAPPVVTRLLREGAPVREDEFGLLSRPIAEYAALALAAAEAEADKLPFMPKRTEEESLAARAISGATSGAAICSAKKRQPVIGALLGALSAAAAGYLLSFLRCRSADDVEPPIPLAAIVEDALAAGVGILVISKLNLEAASPP
ncbi:MAG: DUF4126 family protein [Bryobacteraceae bacterium]